MKAKVILFNCVMILYLAGNRAAHGQVFLSGTNYTQNFNAISNGLPPGWSVRTNATETSLGAATAFNRTNTSWSTGTGQFCNAAGITSNSLGMATGYESTTVQAAFTNRCLGIRQTAAFGDPGAAFVFQIANTAGCSNLVFHLDLNLLRTNGYSTTWSIDYAVGNAPAGFTTLGTYSDPGIFGTTNESFALGNDADDQTNNVWIRVVALQAATGSGSRYTFGIDNFVFNYATTNMKTPGSAIPLRIQIDGQNAMLIWTDATFALQAAPTPAGVFTNVTGAASPFTHARVAPATFYRLIR